MAQNNNKAMSVKPEKWGVIYNPKAGTRKVQKRWKEIKEYMDSRGVAYDYVQSEGFGSVERLTGILANNGYRTIVIVGGDGALNDAINGIMHSSAEQKEEIAGNVVKSPIVGTFYASAAPDKPPYVTVGKEVSEGDVLFIIESMKLMNEVTSEFSGTVEKILVQNGQAVEYGQPIMIIR